MTATLPAPFRGRGRLEHVVAELRRQIDTRVDFVVDTADLRVQVADGKLWLVPGPSARDFLPADGLPMLDQAMLQLGERATPPVPARFLQAAVAQSPQRIADYLTAVMRDHHARRFVRCLDGKVRAFLSDRYRVIESLDVVGAVLQGAQDRPVRILEASVSDSHVRIKLINPTVWDRLNEGEAAHQWIKPGQRSNADWLARVGINIDDLPMQGGAETLWPIVTVGNSDTGHGGFGARIGLIQAICLNLAVTEQAVAHVHLGERLNEGVFTAETVSAEARAIALKARDVIMASFDQGKFAQLVAAMRLTNKHAVHAPVTAAQNVIGLAGALNERDLDALVRAFAHEPQTVFGIGQAVARLAQDTNDPELANEREALAGAILAGKHTRAVLAAPAS